MLSQVSDIVKIEITPKIKSTHSDFKLLEVSSYCKTYKAKLRETDEFQIIRVLNTTSELYAQAPNTVSTIFLQQMLHLCLRDRELLLIEHTNFHDGRLAYVTKLCEPLSSVLESQAEDPLVNINIEKLIEGLAKDLNFLHEKLRIGELNLTLDKIHRVCGSEEVFLSDWLDISEPKTKPEKEIDQSVAPYDSHMITANELFNIGKLILQVTGIDTEEVSDLPKIKSAPVYNSVLDSVMKMFAGRGQPESVRKAVNKMLQKDIAARGNFNDYLREMNTELKTSKYKEELKISGGLKSLKSTLEVIKDLESNAQCKVAWCSLRANKIDLYDLKGKNTVGSFQGVELMSGENYTYVDSMIDTELLFSVHHYGEEANFEVFSTAGLVQKKYIFEGVQGEGDTGKGDITCNSKRKFAAFIPVEDAVEYHLFDCSTMRIKKKAAWQPKHQGCIESLTFDAEGKLIASLDQGGALIVSTVDTDELVTKTEFKKVGSLWPSRCRWSPIFGSMTIALKHNQNQLTLFDVEKECLIWSDPLIFEKDPIWIDWRCDGDLIACGGYDANIRVCDIRQKKIIKTYSDFHLDEVCSVRWNHDGSLLATCSSDKTINVIDFNSDAAVYTGKTSDSNPASSICFVENQ